MPLPTMPTAEFSVKGEADGIVFIADEDNGRRTVTNDAEAVCPYVNNKFPSKRIVYLGTDGVWTEMIHQRGTFQKFVPFNGKLPKFADG